MIDGIDKTEHAFSVIDLDMDRVRLNPNQPRKFFDEDRLEELALSILENGVLEPVIVRPVDGGAYELVAGERRFRASVRAGLRRIPAVVREMDDRLALEIALIENIQREDIKPIESAQAYRRLMDEFGLSQEEVADRVGKSRSTVANTIRLLNLPIEILNSLDRGEITEGHARALLSVTGRQKQLDVWERVIRKGLNVRETERLARSPRAGTASGRADVARATQGQGGMDPNLQDVEERLRRFLGTKVSISRQPGSKGQIAIEFYDDEDLIRLLELMAGI